MDCEESLLKVLEMIHNDQKRILDIIGEHNKLFESFDRTEKHLFAIIKSAINTLDSLEKRIAKLEGKHAC